jgi:hypothetical protein
MGCIMKTAWYGVVPALATPLIVFILVALAVIVALAFYVRALFVLVLTLADGLAEPLAISTPAWRLGGKTI